MEKVYIQKNINSTIRIFRLLARIWLMHVLTLYTALSFTTLYFRNWRYFHLRQILLYCPKTTLYSRRLSQKHRFAGGNKKC